MKRARDSPGPGLPILAEVGITEPNCSDMLSEEEILENTDMTEKW
jgi:hypothetical protein